MEVTNSIRKDITALSKFFEEKPWGKSQFYDDETGAYCLLGGVNRVVEGHDGDCHSSAFLDGELLKCERHRRATLRSLLVKCIIERYKPPKVWDTTGLLLQFNDNADTSFEDVRQVIDCAVEASK